MGDEVRKALEIQSLEFQHLLQCLQETKWLRKQSDKWFTKLYTYLYNQRLEKEQIQDLKTLRIIRLENNELESISEGNIFFPLNSRENYEFEKELRITKKSLLEVKENKGIYGFLKKLGVQEADPYGIIENHILPVYENYDKTTSRLNKETRTLLGYIRYIKENLKAYEKESNKQLNANKDSWEEKEDPLGRLKNCLLFRTNKTNKSTIYYGKPENIYLPKAYDNGNDLESLFEGIEGISFLHREYIDDTPRKHRRLKQRSKVKLQRTDGMKVKEWKEFFVKLRVNEGLKIIDDYEDFDPDGYYKKDIQPDCWIEYFERIVDGRELEKIKKLILLVESQWIKIKNKMLREIAKRSDGRYKFSYTSVPTRLNKQLTDSEWLPTTEGTLARPSEIFVDKHEIKTILGDGVPYLAVNIKNKELIKALGINLEVNVETVLNHLETLIGQGCKDKSTFEKLYDFLDKRYKNNEKLIKTTFSENPIIYIPDTAQSYFNSKEVLWKDLGDIFGSNRGYLEKHYSKLKSFFVEKLKVSEKPEPRDYANMLIDLSRKENIDEKDEKIILKIYEELENNWFLISTEEWKAFIKEPIFWTDKEEFRYNQDDVFVNDNQELYELFKDNPQLAFLKLPENYYPKLQHFIEVVKISYLSKAVKTKLATGETPRIEQHLTEQIRGLAPYIFRYLYQSEYQIYEKLKSDRVLTKLTNLICYAVERLEVEYILNQQSVSDQRSAILYNGNLYVQNDQQLKDYLAVELSKLFKEVKGLDDFINLLLSKKSEYEIGNLLKAKRIQQLPPGEQEWFGMVKPVSVKEGLVDAEEQTTIKVEHEQIIHSEAASINLIERKMLKSQINTTIPKPLIIEKTKWQPEVEPEEAEISIEEFIPKTKKNKVLPGVREIASRHFLNKFDEEDEDDDKARDILSSEEKRAIGRWGEEYVLKCLKNKLIEDYSKGKLKKTKDGFVIYLGRQKVAEVHWLNKEEDRGEGYDITIIENGNEKYIEVKSTKTDTKEWFDISRRQWEFAQEKGDKFHIYRVYAAGTKHARLMDIVNPIKFWQEGDLIAYPIRISI